MIERVREWARMIERVRERERERGESERVSANDRESERE